MAERRYLPTVAELIDRLSIIQLKEVFITEHKEEYAKRLMTDAQIMDALTGDIYGIGRVIATNKFKYLRYSYMTFLVGISLAISIFSFQVIFFS